MWIRILKNKSADNPGMAHRVRAGRSGLIGTACTYRRIELLNNIPQPAAGPFGIGSIARPIDVEYIRSIRVGSFPTRSSIVLQLLSAAINYIKA